MRHQSKEFASRPRSRHVGAALLVIALVSPALLPAAGTPPSTLQRAGMTVQQPAQQSNSGLVSSDANFGRPEGQFSVSGDGAATYTLPLWMPKGRGNVAPELTLSYNSRGGRGPFGVGWSLGGLSSIAWCPRTVAQDGYTDGAHTDGTSALCLGDNRLLPVSPPFSPVREYRTERATFMRIVGYETQDNVPDYFRVWSKDGRILTFGETPDSRLDGYPLQASPDMENPTVLRAPPSRRQTLAWGLNRIGDRNGNAATVTYRRAEGTAADLWWSSMLPASVTYSPNRRVEFHYEPRPDPIDRFTHGGMHTRIAERASSIDMWAGPQNEHAELVRQYRLTYQNDSVTRRSLLHLVSECDHNGTCKWPLQFEWSLGQNDFDEIPIPGHTEADWSTIQIADVNGDGRSDLLQRPDAWKQDPFFDSDNLTGIRRSISGTFTPSQYSDPDTVGYDETGTYKLRIADLDVDGRPEMAAQVLDDPIDSSWGWKLYQSTGTRFERAPYDNIGGSHSTWDNIEYQDYFADLNGDGLLDLVEIKSGVDGGGLRYRLNRGSQPHRFGDWIGSAIARIASFEQKNFVMDTDGDGRAELLTRSPAGPGWDSWGLSAAGTEETAVVNLAGGSELPAFGDVNGDGLDDQIVIAGAANDTAKLTTLLNTGTGFSLRPSVPVEGASDLDLLRSRLRVVDFDNDGRDDVLILSSGRSSVPDDAIHGVQLYRWTDHGFERESLGLQLADMPSCEPPNSGQNGCNWSGTQPLDFDADGLLDLVNFTPGSAEARLFVHRGEVPDQIISIGDALRTPNVMIDYTNLADRSVHTPGRSCGYPLICPASGGSMVKQHRVAQIVGTGQDVWDRYDHRYRSARVDLRGPGWLGFAEHSVTRTSTGEVAVTTFDNTTSVVRPTSEYTSAVVYPYAGVPKSVTTRNYDQPNNIFRRHRRTVDYGNAVRRYGNGSFFVEQRAVTMTDQETGYQGSGWQTLARSTATTTYDEFGNKDLVVSAVDGGRRLTVDTDFSNDTAAWLIGRPNRTLVTGCTASNVCATRETTFDDDDRGNPAVSVVEPSRPELKLTTTTTYGPFGVVASISRTDAAGHIRADTYEYDADQLYPTAIVNAMGHRTTVETHSGLGVPLTVTDPNGVPTTMRYDWFGRPRETNYADGHFQHVGYLNFLGVDAVFINESGGGGTTIVFDRLGREIERNVRTFDGGGARTYTQYDALGQTERISRPTMGGGEQALYTQFRFDLRGRLAVVTSPDGAQVHHEYRGHETHTYDAKDVHSNTIDTPDGQVESSYDDDPNSTDWLRTQFAYGPFGEIDAMVAPDGTTQTMHYDGLGRRDRLQDPSSGTTITTYNAFGEAATVTDTEDRTTTLEYDPLGRTKKVTSPDGVATNTWDTALHGLGRLAEARSTDGVTINYTYDELARNSTATWTIAGTHYEFKYGYDSIGRLACLTYPAVPGTTDRLTVGYGYNSRGYLAQVTDGCEAGGHFYWSAEARNGSGQLERERLGNGVITTRTYEPATGLLDRILTTPPGTAGSPSEIAYEYDANHNVIRRNDVTHQRDETYQYDNLDRLSGWSIPGVDHPHPGLNASYAYDTVGNLRTETVNSTNRPEQITIYEYGQNNAPPHALTALNSQSYGYDSLGQQTSGPGRTVRYNTVGLPTVLNWRIGQLPERHTTFAYDPYGARTVKRDEDQTTITVNGLFDRRTPAGTGGKQIHNLHNIVVGGRVIAQVNRIQAATGGPVTASRVTYLHTDLQGSTVSLTNFTGEPSSDEWLRQQFYDPFGRRINDQNQPLGEGAKRGGPRQGYTGHEHDDDYGLINMKGRIYDPILRRFLTPDPILQNPLSGQSHNRYSYVRNNPTTLIDPTGYQGCDPENSSCLPGLEWPSDSQQGSSDGGGEDYLFGSNVITPDGIDDDVAWPEVNSADPFAGAAVSPGGSGLNPFAFSSLDEVVAESERTIARIKNERLDAEARARELADEEANHKVWLVMGGALLLATGVGALVELGVIGVGAASVAGEGALIAEGSVALSGAGGGIAAAANRAAPTFAEAEAATERFVAGLGRAGAGGWTQVQRWMSNAEALEWAGRSSIPQPLPGVLGYSVSQWGASRAGAAVNEVLVEFEVPTQWLVQGGRSDWFTIYNTGRLVPIRDLIVRW
jgi:RHS repeat-associated protein